MLILENKNSYDIKILKNLWRALEMSLINCKINVILNCSANCIISGGDTETIFGITDTKFMFLLELFEFPMIQNYCNN